MVNFSREDILSQLDECAAASQFPMLDNGHIYLADTRMSGYGDANRWAIVIEVLGTINALGTHYSIHNCLYCFGNCLKGLPGTKPEDVLHPTADGPEGPTFQVDYEWHVHPEAHTIRIRDSVVPITTDPDALEATGVILIEPPEVTVTDILRSLLPKYRDLLFAAESELRQRIPKDLPLLIRLDAWNHPDIVDGEVPSASETFQLLADVLVTGDPSPYHPSQAPNTYWTHWPNGGTL